jgi:hypothetical protein
MGVEKTTLRGSLLSALLIINIRKIKSRRKKWAGHVARTADRRGTERVWVGIPEGRNHFEDLSIDRRIILKWILGKWDAEVWTELLWC